MKVKFTEKFSWDTDALTEYIDENIDDLETRLVDEARTARFMRTQEGLKGIQRLNDIETDFPWQDGSVCGNNPQGTATFGRKSIEVGDIEIYVKFCNKDLIGFWPMTKLAKGAEGEMQSLPFEQVIMDHAMAQNALKVDLAIWKSDKNSDNVELNRFDGLIKQAGADSEVIDLTLPGGATAISDSNAIASFQSFDTQLPQELVEKENFAYCTDRTTFMKLRQNMYDTLKLSPQYDIEAMVEGGKKIIGVYVPVTMQKVYWVPGLKNTGMVFGALWGNTGQMIIGTDRQSDFDQIESWYEKKERSLYFRICYRLGTTYRFGENVGLYRPTTS